MRSPRRRGSNDSRGSASSCSGPRTGCSFRSASSPAWRRPIREGRRSLSPVSPRRWRDASRWAAGPTLASEAEEALYAAEIADEGREVETEPEREVAELALVLEDEGLPPESAERVAEGLAANPNVFLRTKVEKELGLSPDVGGAALGDALVVGGTYLGAAIVPLWP